MKTINNVITLLMLAGLAAGCIASQPALQITPPQPTQTDTLRIYKDIPYTSTKLFDIYQPAATGPHPLVLILHGGGMNKERIMYLSRVVAQLGAVVFTPTYSSGAPMPSYQRITQGPEDAACALRFAKAVSAQFDADPGRVLVIGHSAGGFVGADLALAGDEFHGDCLIDKGSALPDAFVGLDGAYDVVNCCIDSIRLEQASRNEWDRIVPFTYIGHKPVHAGLAFFLVYGLEPELKDMALAFAAALEAAGYPVTVSESPGTDHLLMTSPESPGILSAIQQALALLKE